MNTGIFRSLRVLVTATALAGAFCTAFAQTQAYPSRPVKLVVPAAAGTAMDTTGRLIAEELKAAFNQAVIVENRLGAQLIIGTEYVAKSPPDGYTLVLGSNTSHSSNPYLFKRIGYDPIKDFAPVSGLMTLPVVVVDQDQIDAVGASSGDDLLRSIPQMGDVLFVLANLARRHGIDPETALRAGNAKFERRFKAMESLAGPDFPALPLDAQEDYWQQVKAAERR